ncbi:hypothetical protein L9F63_009559, partial [Diploptera punctata]
WEVTLRVSRVSLTEDEGKMTFETGIMKTQNFIYLNRVIEPQTSDSVRQRVAHYTIRDMGLIAEAINNAIRIHMFSANRIFGL